MFSLPSISDSPFFYARARIQLKGTTARAGEFKATSVFNIDDEALSVEDVTLLTKVGNLALVFL